MECLLGCSGREELMIVVVWVYCLTRSVKGKKGEREDEYWRDFLTMMATMTSTTSRKFLIGCYIEKWGLMLFCVGLELENWTERRFVEG